ncbi:hypothetical protein [Burkholderia sp. IMCC1007]|uniref:hypothetical protein n=1 Tax=Burkholderia sp. IMCC1007 TaxID=3004104 RepID=UPI0022B550DD|nr:hypothetical protein [Burkholderia sp. IMCC1007]
MADGPCIAVTALRSLPMSCANRPTMLRCGFNVPRHARESRHLLRVSTVFKHLSTTLKI